MKQLYNLFLLTAAAALAFSCSKPDNGENPDNGETPKTVILLSEDEITADADGGNFTVQWEVENPVEGTEYSVNASEEWIENLDWENMGTINFSIPANTSEEAREGMITIEYGTVCSDTINIRQEGREVSYPAPEDIIGVWKVIGDRWDLDNGESSCYLMDDESEDGYAHDENGNFGYTPVWDSNIYVYPVLDIKDEYYKTKKENLQKEIENDATGERYKNWRKGVTSGRFTNYSVGIVLRYSFGW